MWREFTVQKGIVKDWHKLTTLFVVKNGRCRYGKLKAQNLEERLRVKLNLFSILLAILCLFVEMLEVCIYIYLVTCNFTFALFKPCVLRFFVAFQIDRPMDIISFEHHSRNSLAATFLVNENLLRMGARVGFVGRRDTIAHFRLQTAPFLIPISWDKNAISVHSF